MPFTSETTSEPLLSASTRTHGASSESFEHDFSELFRVRFPMLYRYLSRISGDPTLADDVAQESFVRLHARGSMPDNPAAWLVSVANNIVRDERRTSQRRRRLLTSWMGGEEQGQRTPPTDARVLEGEQTSGVRRALESLRPRDQRMLILRHEGFSYREIAEALGVAPGSVGTLLVRATAALSKVYRELDHASD